MIWYKNEIDTTRLPSNGLGGWEGEIEGGWGVGRGARGGGGSAGKGEWGLDLLTFSIQEDI